MFRTMLAPILFGLIGAGILLALGVWQLQRLVWKQGVIAEIAAQVDGQPQSLTLANAAQLDKFAPVTFAGRTGEQEIHVLVSRKLIGAGYRVVTSVQTADGQRVLLDRGFIPTTMKNDPRPPQSLQITGNIHIPDDRNSATPDNDEVKNIWFARDIAAMARVLDTDPILIVARSDTGQGIAPMPLSVEGVPNDHLLYAVTWFSLAFVWLGMTGFLLWRIKRRTA